MEEELNDLLTQAQENISDNVDKQTEFTYRNVLEQALKELDNLKSINKEYVGIRNTAIKNLYGIGYTAIELAEICKMSRQMIHNIVKGK